MTRPSCPDRKLGPNNAAHGAALQHKASFHFLFLPAVFTAILLPGCEHFKQGPRNRAKKCSVPHSTEKISHRNEIALDRCIFHLQQSRAISGSSWYLTSWLPLFLQIRRHTFAARRIYQRTFLDETLGRPFWLYYNKSGRQFQEPGSTKSRGANYTSLQSLSKSHFCCCLPGFAVIY